MMDEDEPASKRSRTEENLVPEGEFLAEPESRHHEGGRAEHAGQARVEAGGSDAEHHPRPHRHRQHSQGPDHGRAWNAARETETSARIHILKGCKQPGVLQHYARDSAEFAVQGERRTKKINCTFVCFRSQAYSGFKILESK